MPTFEDECDLFGESDADATVNRLMSLGSDEVVVKRGSDAVVLSSGDKTTYVAPHAVDQIVDTTGALVVVPETAMSNGFSSLSLVSKSIVPDATPTVPASSWTVNVVLSPADRFVVPKFAARL